MIDRCVCATFAPGEIFVGCLDKCREGVRETCPYCEYARVAVLTTLLLTRVFLIIWHVKKLLMKMKGFLVFHRTHGRHVFVDELYVVPRERRRGVAGSMLYSICHGPIELIVHATNAPAVALYSSLRFCSTDEGSYAPKSGEICMKTQSYRKTLAKLRPRHSCTRFTWAQLSSGDRSRMIACVKREQGIGDRAAKERLFANDEDTRYVIV